MSSVQRLIEGDYAGEFLVSEMDRNYCRENVVVTGPVKRNQVVADGAGEFVGITFVAVRADETKKVGLLVRGPAEVSLAKLVFPVVTDAVDGPDVGSDNTAENAAATTALRQSLITAMRDAGIVVRA